MAFCKNCGSEVTDDTRFCPSCGNPVAQEPGSVPAEPAAETPAQATPAAPVAADPVQQPAPEDDLDMNAPPIQGSYQIPTAGAPVPPAAPPAAPVPPPAQPTAPEAPPAQSAASEAPPAQPAAPEAPPAQPAAPEVPPAQPAAPVPPPAQSTAPEAPPAQSAVPVPPPASEQAAYTPPPAAGQAAYTPPPQAPAYGAAAAAGAGSQSTLKKRLPIIIVVIVVVVLAIVLIVNLGGKGGGGKSAYLGTWEATMYEMNGEEYLPSEYGPSTLEFFDDGTMRGTLIGEVTEANWKEISGGVLVESEGAEQELTYDGKVLTMDLGMIVIRFEKAKAGAAPALPAAEEANTQEAIDYWTGDWVGWIEVRNVRGDYNWGGDYFGDIDIMVDYDSDAGKYFFEGFVWEYDDEYPLFSYYVDLYPDRMMPVIGDGDAWIDNKFLEESDLYDFVVFPDIGVEGRKVSFSYEYEEPDSPQEGYDFTFSMRQVGDAWGEDELLPPSYTGSVGGTAPAAPQPSGPSDEGTLPEVALPNQLVDPSGNYSVGYPADAGEELSFFDEPYILDNNGRYEVRFSTTFSAYDDYVVTFRDGLSSHEELVQYAMTVDGQDATVFEYNDDLFGPQFIIAVRQLNGEALYICIENPDGQGTMEDLKSIPEIYAIIDSIRILK